MQPIPANVLLSPRTFTDTTNWPTFSGTPVRVANVVIGPNGLAVTDSIEDNSAAALESINQVVVLPSRFLRRTWTLTLVARQEAGQSFASMVGLAQLNAADVSQANNSLQWRADTGATYLETGDAATVIKYGSIVLPTQEAQYHMLYLTVLPKDALAKMRVVIAPAYRGAIGTDGSAVAAVGTIRLFYAALYPGETIFRHGWDVQT